MIAKIFKLITKILWSFNIHPDSSEFVQSLAHVYRRVQYLTVNKVAPVPGSVLDCAQRNNFLNENPSRINAVADMLYDEKSKRTYLGLIKYRRTGLKEDWPIEGFVKTQYIIDELPFGEDEIFVDCGAFVGNSIKRFIKRCGDYKGVIAFEPDVKNFQKLRKRYGRNPKMTLINAGVYDRDGEIEFLTHKTGISNIDAKTVTNTVRDSAKWHDEKYKIKIRSIDGLNITDKITFIAMDVEGAELCALKGARETILRDRPKLAVCIYHSNEDMIQLAEYIHELAPEYKLYVRQHCFFPSCGETVLYAVP